MFHLFLSFLYNDSFLSYRVLIQLSLFPSNSCRSFSPSNTKKIESTNFTAEQWRKIQYTIQYSNIEKIDNLIATKLFVFWVFLYHFCRLYSSKGYRERSGRGERRGSSKKGEGGWKCKFIVAFTFAIKIILQMTKL